MLYELPRLNRMAYPICYNTQQIQPPFYLQHHTFPSISTTESVTVPISGKESSIEVGASVKGNTAAADKVDSVIGDDTATDTISIDFSGMDSKESITNV